MRIEPLGEGVEVCVSDRHHFSTDTILLADFARVKNGESVVELGTGCGTIPLLMIKNNSPKEIYAIEIQDDAVDLLQESLRRNLLNGIENAALIHSIRGDIRNVRELLPAGSADLVVCNPPYKLSGSGIENPDDGKKTARHEVECTLEDVCAAANWLLRFSGRLVICQRPERLTDLLGTMRAYDLEPKRLRMVQGRLDKPPKLVLIEAKRGAKHGYMEVQPALIVEDQNGFTPEMRSIYGSYKDGYDE